MKYTKICGGGKANKPFSCSESSCCKAVAASIRTGISTSLDRMLRITSSAVRRLLMFLNFTSAKLLTTQHAYNINKYTHCVQCVGSSIALLSQPIILSDMIYITLWTSVTANIDGAAFFPPKTSLWMKTNN